jgi:coproporphyrinogen III oxidase-like Fe-S oxidoreductase
MLLKRTVESLFLPELRKKGKFTHLKSGEFSLPRTKQIGMYIHIPFCFSLCPYCPYDRILFNKNISERYVNALLKEIDFIYRKLGNVRINSLYIGGGTPTTVGANLLKIVEKLNKYFTLEKDSIFIETNPCDINEEKMQILKKMGTIMISIGIQSFQDKFLKAIGRNYDRKTAIQSIEIAKKYIDNINIDLMFALPDQKEKDFKKDLETAISFDVQQVTSYPLFTFPYSTVGSYLKINKVKLPDFKTRKRMFYLMYDLFTSNGYMPASVWGFVKNSGKEFSSVSRMYYIGLGASAATKVPGRFYLNTFSVPHYIERVNDNLCAEVVKMDYTKRMDNYYWLYWKMYETRFSELEFKNRFENDRKIKLFVQFLLIGKFLELRGAQYKLTRKGMLYVHLLQNLFALNYISKTWDKMMKNKEPEKIIL